MWNKGSYKAREFKIISNDFMITYIYNNKDLILIECETEGVTANSLIWFRLIAMKKTLYNSW